MRRNAMKGLACAAIMLLLFTSFLMMRGNASGTTELSGNEVAVIVGSGDTLWGIARQHVDKGDDIRYVVYSIMERNELKDPTIVPGQRLIIPDV